MARGYPPTRDGLRAVIGYTASETCDGPGRGVVAVLRAEECSEPDPGRIDAGKRLSVRVDERAEIDAASGGDRARPPAVRDVFQLQELRFQAGDRRGREMRHRR